MKEKSSADRLSIFGLMVKPVQRFPQFIMLLQVSVVSGQKKSCKIHVPSSSAEERGYAPFPDRKSDSFVINLFKAMMSLGNNH